MEALDSAGTVIVPTWSHPDVAPPAQLTAALAEAYRDGASVVGLCLGAFVLAAAGLLDGRRATTHWMCSAALAERYPKVRVEADVLYVEDGRVLTSAGSSAGIDACLHWLLHQRVLRAQRLLESTDLPVDAVASAVGFTSAVTLRPHFRRLVGVAPQAYRAAFRNGATE